jgi:hypothetical protein
MSATYGVLVLGGRATGRIATLASQPHDVEFREPLPRQGSRKEHIPRSRNPGRTSGPAGVWACPVSVGPRSSRVCELSSHDAVHSTARSRSAYCSLHTFWVMTQSRVVRQTAASGPTVRRSARPEGSPAGSQMRAPGAASGVSHWLFRDKSSALSRSAFVAGDGSASRHATDHG